MDARASLQMMSNDVDLPQGTVLEVLLAEIENRLRRTILRIIRPTLDQTADISARLLAITTKVEHHEANLNACDQLRIDMKKQAEVTAVLQEQISAQYDQARTFESNTTEHLTNVRLNITDVERKLEEQQNDIKLVKREGVRTWEEVDRMRVELEDTTKCMEQNIRDSFKVMDQNRSELLDRIAEIDKARMDLIDDLFGEDRGITRMRSDILHLTKFVEPLPQVELDLATLQQRTGSVEQRQDDCERFCENAKISYNGFTQHCEGRLGEMREEFREGMNELVAHHGSLLKAMRSDFASELQASQRLRSQITDIEGKTAQFCCEMSKKVHTESNRLSAVQTEITKELDELNKKRKKDRYTFDADLRDMKVDVGRQQEIVSTFHGSLSHLGRVLGLSLESQRVASAMQVQDYADRCGERWLGKPELGRRAAPAHTADMVEQLPYRSDTEPSSRCAGNPSMHNLVPIDSKKGLASVEYLPGPVAYQGKQYDRKDFLVLHDRLLQKAHLAYEKGPQKDAAAALAASSGALLPAAVRPPVPLQPRARGGEVAAGEAASHARPVGRSKKEAAAEDDLEDPKSTTASSQTHRYASRQRPGSRDQPQGTGSRGTMFGSLGETSPPDTASALPHGVHPHSLPSAKANGVRLPAISLDDLSSKPLATADGPGATTHGVGREQPSATDAGGRGARHQAEEHPDVLSARKCHTAR